jgi:hypothetical protein
MATRKGLQKPIAGKYKAELAEPIYLSRGRTLADLGKTEEQQIDELVDRFHATRVAKFGLLFQHYGIDPASEDAWGHLAMSLAFDHVPGMNFAIGEKPRRGRRRSWQDGLGFELVRDVEAIQKDAERPISISAAIELLRKNKKQRWGGYTQENLVTRHREAKRRSERLRPIVEAMLRPRLAPSSPLPIMGSLPSPGTSLTPTPTARGLFSFGMSLLENGVGEPKTDEKSLDEISSPTK